MSKQKTVVITMCKAHRILVTIIFGLLFLFMLAGILFLVLTADYAVGIHLLLIAVPIILFLPCPLYYATWQIIFDADGIQKRLWGIKYKKHPWTQIQEVRSGWLISERNYGISILFKNKTAIRFRMDCENAKLAKKLILSHCSIIEHPLVNA